VEAVPHIDLLRQIQPLVLDGLDYSKALAPTLLRLLPTLTRPPSLQSLLMQVMALVEDKVQSIRSAPRRPNSQTQFLSSVRLPPHALKHGADREETLRRAMNAFPLPPALHDAGQGCLTAV
jgi:hypothetical protein